MTKASVKKTWGQIYLGAFLFIIVFIIYKNVGIAEIVRICVNAMIMIIGILFGLKVATGAINKLPDKEEK